MLKKLAFACALLATFTGAHAQSSQNFGITGQVTPGACTVTLNGGGIVNVGDVSKTTAMLYPIITHGNTAYRFPVRAVSVNITCAAVTKVALSFVDNKPAQRLGLDNVDAARYGLGDGTAGTAAIGVYTITFSNTTIDGAAVGQFLSAANGSATFSATQPVGISPFGTNLAAPGRTVAFAKTAGVTVPDAFTSLTGTLNIESFVSKPYIDAATIVVTPTGSGTLTLVYL